MPTRTRYLLAIALLGLFTASGFSVYYRSLATQFEERWKTGRMEAEAARTLLQPTKADTPQAAPVAPAPAPPPAPAEESRDDEVRVLRSRVQELQAALDAKDQAVRAPESQPTNRPSAGPAGRRDRQAWMEEMKKNDPERYQEMTARREEARQQTRDSLARKAAYLLNRDTSDMNDDERESYNQMLQLLDDAWEFSEQLRTDPPREERHELWQNLRETVAALEPMMRDERDREFYSLGLEAGCSEAEARALVNHLNEVLDLTSLRNVYEGMRPGGPRGPR